METIERVVGADSHNDGVAPLPQTDRPLVGRTDELALLRARTFESDQCATTLLGGDAGVGKTRLLTSLMHDAVAGGARVLLGHCLDLGDSSAPYLPFAEMFARLAQDEHQLAMQLVADRPLLGPLLPEFYRRELPVGLPTDRGSFFDTVHMTFEQLGEERPLVLVVEDAHWADRSTRELLTFLFTRGFTSRVGLVVSYRSDDLHRRHPLRPKLAEWSRLPMMRRIGLTGLSDAEMADLVHRLRPETPAVDTDTIVSRAAGNPFFAEELLAACRIGDAGIPDELADLLLVRIDALDDAARATVRAASVAGGSVAHPLLAEVVESDDTALADALRSLVDGHILEVTSTGSYAFRHALLGEAVYDDLLPGERVALHGRFAEALRSSTAPADTAALARHARLAGKHELALDASVRAGDAAMAARGPADAATHYENALAQLAERPDTGDHVPLAIRTVRALVAAGNPHRAAETAARAYDLPGGSDDDRSMLVAEMVSAQLLSDHALPSLDLLRQVIAEHDGRPPVPATAALHAVLARACFFLDDFEGALLAANQATALARALDLPRVATDALTTLARLDEFIGDPADAEKQLRELVDEARVGGQPREELRALHQLGRVQGGRSQYRDASETFREAVRRAAAVGLTTDPYAVESRAFAALYSLMTGDGVAADEMLDIGRMALPPLADASLGTVRMMRDARRGDSGVLDALPRLRQLWPRDMFTCIHTGAIAIDTIGASGDLDAMLAIYDEVVDIFTRVWSLPSFDGRIRLSALTIGHLADHAPRDARSRTAWAERADALLHDAEQVAALRPNEQVLGVESRAWLLRARAEHRRFEWGGRGPVPDELLTVWSDTVTIFTEHDEPYERARSELRYAAVLADAGRRDDARDLFDAARATARAIGATSLVAGSRRSPDHDEPGGLTPREREVLELLVAGDTNGRIAKALFISPKTASVHVSNILAKLGAATRTEAAAIARRDQLV